MVLVFQRRGVADGSVLDSGLDSGLDFADVEPVGCLGDWCCSWGHSGSVVPRRCSVEWHLVFVAIAVDVVVHFLVGYCVGLGDGPCCWTGSPGYLAGSLG